MDGEKFKLTIEEARNASSYDMEYYIYGDVAVVLINNEYERMKALSGLIFAGCRDIDMSETHIYVHNTAKIRLGWVV